MGCSVNKWKTLGSITNKSIEEWTNSETFRTLVRVLFEGTECPPELPCLYCPNYQKILKNTLTLEGLEQYNRYVPTALKKNELSK